MSAYNLITTVAHYSLTPENVLFPYIPFRSTPEWGYSGIRRVESCVAVGRKVTFVGTERKIKG